MRTLRAAAVCLAVCLAAAPSAAQLSGYYTIHPFVPTVGNNFQTLAAALAALHSQPVVGPTTFQVFDDAGPWTEANPVMTFINGGTAVLSVRGNLVSGISASNPVVFEAAPGELPVFDATGQPFGIVLHGTHHVTVKGFEIRNASSDGVSIYTDSVTQGQGDLHDNAVIGCRIHDIGGCGINVYQNGGTPAVAFVGTILRNNFLWRCQITHGGGNNAWRNGYVNERRSRDAIIEHNTIFADTGTGIDFGLYVTWYAAPLGGPAASFRNNVLVKTVLNGAVIRHVEANSMPVLQDNNAYEDLSGGAFLAGASGTAATFAAFRSSFAPLEANGVTGPMRFPNAPAGDLHLGAGSVAIDRGATIAAVIDDIDGELRPQGAAYDAGADESTGNVAAANPYGTGCAGSNGVPTFAGVGVPSLGNTAFALAVAGARPNSVALLAAALAPQVPGLPLGGGCLLFLSPASTTTLLLVVTSSGGTATFAVPVPNAPQLAGSRFDFQAGVLDPATVLGATATNAVELVVY